MSDNQPPFTLEDDEPEEREDAASDARAPAARPAFELEEDEGTGPEPAPPATAPEPRVAPVPEDRPPPTPAPDPDTGIDTRTLKERQGKARPRGAEPLDLPPEWPREAFAYPLRGEGPYVGAGLITALILLDLLGSLSFGLFPAWILKLITFAFLLRLQVRYIATTATGSDVPLGWQQAIRYENDELKRWGSFMAMFVASLVPGFALVLLNLLEPGIAVLAFASMYVSVLAVGSAVSDPSLKYPWKAIGWMLRHPVACVVGSLGWWTIGLAEYAIMNAYGTAAFLFLFEAVVLRVLVAYMAMLSARFLGVMARRWRA